LVKQAILADSLIFQNNLGTFHLPTVAEDMGAGYITRWEAPDGSVLAEAKPSGSDSGSAYLNDPSKGLGIGAFGAYVAFHSPPWIYWDRNWSPSFPDQPSAWTTGLRMTGFPGIAWPHDRMFDHQNYQQTFSLLRDAIQVTQHWQFMDNSVRLHSMFRIDKTFGKLDAWIKEPEYVFSLNGDHKINRIETPGCGCQTYTGLTDPQRRTGRCSDRDRSHVLLGGGRKIRIQVEDRDWRQLGRNMGNWKAAGNVGCMTHLGYRKRPPDNWEYIVWNLNSKPFFDSFSCNFKAAEGCVKGGGTEPGWEKLVAPSFYRRPDGGTRWYTFSMAFGKG
jgi:hypothetical protein